MNISRASIKDIEIITGFQTAMALESEGLLLDGDVVARGVKAALEDESKGSYIIAEVGGKTVASLMITREWSDWNNGWYWWIQSVYVVPELRGRGVFKAMYAKVRELAAQEQVLQVRLYVDKTNTDAQRVYQRLGMEECHYLMYEASTQE